MAEISTSDISKADVERFLFGKHLVSCHVCGRFRSRCDIGVHALTCQRAASPDCSQNTPIDVLMIVCQNCGAIQFHDRSIIAQWLGSHKVLDQSAAAVS